MEMPEFGTDLEQIFAFEIGDEVLFKHYFELDAIFRELQNYYERDAYRFAVPAEKFETVKDTLAEYGYELVPVAATDFEDYCVVKEQYTIHAEILRNAVMHWSRDGYNFFLMKDPLSVDQAVEQGATRIAETNLVVGL